MASPTLVYICLLIIYWLISLSLYIAIYPKTAKLKKVQPCKMACMKKQWNQRGAAKKLKKLIKTISTCILCCLTPASLAISTKFTWIVVIKIITINLYHDYHHSHFLAAPFDFTTFFKQAILNRAAPFFTACSCCFCVDITSFLQLNLYFAFTGFS